ncbi:MAG: MerR family transcriptional regulator [Thermoleophilaceae bacterium]|jgi:DNA-binding transcriptional MerR regulator
MSGIRTNAAAELLGVSPNTLRSWERRFGYPRPRRTEGGHRQYELADLEALRRALLETHNISSAIEVARQRGEGPTSPARLVEAFDRFDEHAADRTMEESLAVRSVERTVEELLLPSLVAASDRLAREAESEFGARWATGWLHAARRVVPAPTRPEAVLIFDSSTTLDVETVEVQALELGLRRAGFRTLLLSVALERERLTRALRGSKPAAIVLAGTGATLDVVGRIVYAARHAAPGARVLEYRDATPVAGKHSVPSLGVSPSEAVTALRERFESAVAQRPRLVERPPAAVGGGAVRAVAGAQRGN